MVQKPEKTFVGLSLCPYRNTEQCPSNAVTYDTYSDLEYTQSLIHTKAVQEGLKQSIMHACGRRPVYGYHFWCPPPHTPEWDVNM